MLLLGARPGHGKTMLGLQLLLDAAREGRRSVFFTLEYTEQEARAHIQSLDEGDHRLADRLEIVTSDDISADFIVRHISGSPRGTLAVVDYLQILDQQRSKPALSDQMSLLKAFAHKAGTILGFISQISRAFDSEASRWPGIPDIRLPNPIGPGVFSKACFLHEGEVRFQDVA
jgi:replicative DNA helicase